MLDFQHCITNLFRGTASCCVDDVPQGMAELSVPLFLPSGWWVLHPRVEVAHNANVIQFGQGPHFTQHFLLDGTITKTNHSIFSKGLPQGINQSLSARLLPQYCLAHGKPAYIYARPINAVTEICKQFEEKPTIKYLPQPTKWTLIMTDTYFMQDENKKSESSSYTKPGNQV